MTTIVSRVVIRVRPDAFRPRARLLDVGYWSDLGLVGASVYPVSSGVLYSSEIACACHASASRCAVYRHAVRVRRWRRFLETAGTLGFVVPSPCARAHTVTVPAQRDATAIHRTLPSVVSATRLGLHAVVTLGGMGLTPEVNSADIRTRESSPVLTVTSLMP